MEKKHILHLLELVTMQQSSAIIWCTCCLIKHPTVDTRNMTRLNIIDPSPMSALYDNGCSLHHKMIDRYENPYLK